MKRIILSISISSLFLLGAFSVHAQCSIQGLQPQYCQGDSPVILTATPPGGFFMGTGILNDSIFDPAAAGTGTHNIFYSNGTTNSYLIVQSGTFSPEPGSGTSVSLGDDQVSVALPIGFQFEFFTNQYTQFYISSNGFLTFSAGSPNGCCSGQILPNASAPNNLIAFAWEDINPSAGGTIEYFTIGTAPNRKLVVNFNNVPHFGSSTNNITVQTQLHETTNIIEVHSTTMPSDGGSHTQGIENLAGSVAYTPPGRNASGTWSLTNDYVAFVPACTNQQTTVLAAPVITTTQSSSNQGYICLGEGDTITAAGATIYDWSPGGTLNDSTAATVIASPTDTTTYTVESMDISTGCITTVAVTVNVNQPPALDLGSDMTLCFWDVVVLDAGAGGSIYSWNTGGVSQWQAVNTQTIGYGTTPFTVTKTDSYGCSTTDMINITVVNCVSVEEHSLSELIDLYPNPSTGWLNLNVSGNTEGGLLWVQILDISGKTVYHRQLTIGVGGELRTTLDLGQLSTGIYMARIQMNGQESIHKIVIQ